MNPDQLVTPSPMPVPEPLSQSEFSIGSVWKKAWTTFTERFRGIIALTLIPWIIIMIAIIIVVVLSVGSTSFFSNLFPGSPVSLILPVIFGVACVFFAFIVILRSQIGLIFLISGQQTTPWTAFKAAKGKVLSYLWVTILGALVTYGGFVLLIIPGIYIAVAVVFAYIVCVMEGDKGLGALVKSREYVRGRWWKVFGYMASVVVIGLFVNILLSLFGDKGVIGITFSILSVLFQIMYGAFFVVFLFTLYGELKSSRPEIGTMVVQKKKTGYVILAILGVLAPLAIISVMAASLPFAFSALQGNGYFVESTEPTMVSERALALTIPAGFVKIPSPEGYAIYGSDNGVLILKSADMSDGVTGTGSDITEERSAEEITGEYALEDGISVESITVDQVAGVPAYKIVATSDDADIFSVVYNFLKDGINYVVTYTTDADNREQVETQFQEIIDSAALQ